MSHTKMKTKINRKENIGCIINNLEEESSLDIAERWIGWLTSWTRGRRKKDGRTSQKAVPKIEDHGTP